MSSLALFILLSLITLHACDARPLGFVHKEGRYFVQGGGKMTKLHELSFPSIPVSSSQTQQQQLDGKNERNSQESWGSGAIMTREKDSKDPLKEDEKTNGKITSGNERKLVKIVSYPKESLQQAASETEGWKREARLMVETKQHDNEETIDSKEVGVVEDVVVMDYAQPHRKPPIHNEEP